MVNNERRLNQWKHHAISGPEQSGILPAWLYSDEQNFIPGCKLTAISPGGGTLLVPKYQAIPASTFDLVIMSPDASGEVLTILHSEQRWRDDEFSEDYIKVIIAFLFINPVKLRAINKLIEIIK